MTPAQASIDISDNNPQNAVMAEIDFPVRPLDRQKKILGACRYLVYFAAAMAIAFFLQLCSQVPHFTIKRHLFRPLIGPLLLVAALVFVFLIGISARSRRTVMKNSPLMSFRSMQDF